MKRFSGPKMTGDPVEGVGGESSGPPAKRPHLSSASRSRAESKECSGADQSSSCPPAQNNRPVGLENSAPPTKPCPAPPTSGSAATERQHLHDVPRAENPPRPSKIPHAVPPAPKDESPAAPFETNPLSAPDHPSPDHPGPDHPGPDHPGPDNPAPGSAALEEHAAPRRGHAAAGHAALDHAALDDAALDHAALEHAAPGQAAADHAPKAGALPPSQEKEEEQRTTVPTSSDNPAPDRAATPPAYPQSHETEGERWTETRGEDFGPALGYYRPFEEGAADPLAAPARAADGRSSGGEDSSRRRPRWRNRWDPGVSGRTTVQVLDVSGDEVARFDAETGFNHLSDASTENFLCEFLRSLPFYSYLSGEYEDDVFQKLTLLSRYLDVTLQPESFVRIYHTSIRDLARDEDLGEWVHHEFPVRLTGEMLRLTILKIPVHVPASFVSLFCTDSGRPLCGEPLERRIQEKGPPPPEGRGRGLSARGRRRVEGCVCRPIDGDAPIDFFMCRPIDKNDTESPALGCISCESSRSLRNLILAEAEAQQEQDVPPGPIVLTRVIRAAPVLKLLTEEEWRAHAKGALDKKILEKSRCLQHVEANGRAELVLSSWRDLFNFLERGVNRTVAELRYADDDRLHPEDKRTDGLRVGNHDWGPEEILFVLREWLHSFDRGQEQDVGVMDRDHNMGEAGGVLNLGEGGSIGGAAATSGRAGREVFGEAETAPAGSGVEGVVVSEDAQPRVAAGAEGRGGLQNGTHEEDRYFDLNMLIISNFFK